MEEALSGLPLLAFSLVLGLLLLVFLWPTPVEAKPKDQAAEEPRKAAEKPPEAEQKAPEDQPAPEAIGPLLLTGHSLWLERLKLLARLLPEPELEHLKRRIWSFLDDRPSVVATGCLDGQARLFSWETGKQLVSVRHDATGRDRVHAVQLSNGPRLLTGSWDGRWHDWQAWPSQPSRPTEFLRGEAAVSHDTQVTALALSRDENFLACASTCGKILVYRRNCPTRVIVLHHLEDVEELRDSLKLGDHGDFVVQRPLELHGMEVEAQEQLLPSGSLEGFTRRAALDEVELPATFHLRFVGCMTHGLRKAYRSLAHDAAVLCMALAHDGAVEVLYSGCRDRKLRKWSLKAGELLATYTGHTSMVRCLAVNACYVASGSDDRTVRLWRRAAGECEKIFAFHTDFVRAVALCNEFRRLLSAGEDRLVVLWDLDTMEQLRRYEHPCVPAAVLLSGSCLATAGEDGRLRIWDTETATLRHSAKHPKSLTSLAWLHGPK